MYLLEVKLYRGTINTVKTSISYQTPECAFNWGAINNLGSLVIINKLTGRNCYDYTKGETTHLTTEKNYYFNHYLKIEQTHQEAWKYLEIELFTGN